MTTSDVQQAVAKRDAAHRRVRHITLGVAAAVVGATSYGAVALAQSTADNGSISTIAHQGAHGNNLSSGTGQTPVATSGGS